MVEGPVSDILLLHTSTMIALIFFMSDLNDGSMFFSTSGNLFIRRLIAEKAFFKDDSPIGTKLLSVFIPNSIDSISELAVSEAVGLL